MSRQLSFVAFVGLTTRGERHLWWSTADMRFPLSPKGGALFVAPPPSPFDSPATSHT